jgi:hypothetical protein
MPSARRGLLAMLLLLPALPACEGPRTIAGRVRDGAGNPVPHARVSARDDVDDEWSTRTDSAGQFSITTFAGMMVTRGWVWIHADGYHPRNIRLPFRTDVEVVLTPDSVQRRGTDWSDSETHFIPGVHYGVPLRWSLGMGVAHGHWASAGEYAGWYLIGESGGGGVKGYAGFARLGPRVGAQLSVAALRTSGHPLTVAPDQTFGGLEARFHLMPLTFTLGGYRRLAGSAPGDARFLSAGVGVGF